jgi:hypothetical protein
MRHYKQLNQDERFYIWNALRAGQTQQEVAEVLGRHPSTIGREIKREGVMKGSSLFLTTGWHYLLHGGRVGLCALSDQQGKIFEKKD